MSSLPPRLPPVEVIIREKIAEVMAKANPQSVLYGQWSKAPEEQKQAIGEAVFFQRFHIATLRLCEKGPSPEVMARYVLGESPKQIARYLTRSEASEWMRQTGEGRIEKPLDFLWHKMCQREPVLADVGKARTFEVARWLEGVLESPKRRSAALRNRETAFGGARVLGRVIDRLDEIKPCDLHRSPLRTLEAAVTRQIDEEWGGENELIEDPAWEARLPEGVNLLWRYTDLRQEGIEMSHCVAAYATSVARKECLIFSLQTPDGRSTLEIKKSQAVQHVGFGNGPVPQANEALAKKLVSLHPWPSEF